MIGGLADIPASARASVWGSGRALCAQVAARDIAMADRMWHTVTMPDGRETVDRRMRRHALRLCAVCPVRLDCLGAAVAGRWKDGAVYGGLDYQRRVVLARLVARDLDEPADAVGFAQVRRWLRKHPDWPVRVDREIRTYWRRRRHAPVASRRGAWRDVAPEFRTPMPVPSAWQPELF